MTTLRDLLNDLIYETEERIQTLVDKGMPATLMPEEKQELVDRYIDGIKRRIIG